MKHRTRVIRKKPIERTGATTVEFALVLPIILALLFGAINCSRAIVIKETARFAAYRAARTGTMPGATFEAVRQAAATEMDMLDIVNYQIEVSPQLITTDTETVTVEVTVPMGNNMIVGSSWLMEMDIQASCTLRTERVSTE